MVSAASDKAPGSKVAVSIQRSGAEPRRLLPAFQQPPSFANRLVRIARAVQNRNGYGTGDAVMVLPAAESL